MSSLSHTIAVQHSDQLFDLLAVQLQPLPTAHRHTLPIRLFSHRDGNCSERYFYSQARARDEGYDRTTTHAKTKTIHSDAEFFIIEVAATCSRVKQKPSNVDNKIAEQNRVGSRPAQATQSGHRIRDAPSLSMLRNRLSMLSVLLSRAVYQSQNS